MKPKKKKENRGGPGRNQGRHYKYGEKTKQVGPFRCPVSKADELKKIVNDKLAEWLSKMRP